MGNQCFDLLFVWGGLKSIRWSSDRNLIDIVLSAALCLCANFQLGIATVHVQLYMFGLLKCGRVHIDVHWCPDCSHALGLLHDCCPHVCIMLALQCRRRTLLRIRLLQVSEFCASYTTDRATYIAILVPSSRCFVLPHRYFIRFDGQNEAPDESKKSCCS